MKLGYKLLIIMSMVLLVLPITAQAILTDDLISYWDFDVNESDVYGTAGGVNVNTPVHTDYGLVGTIPNAYEYQAGDTDLTRFNNLSIPTMSTGTINLWVNLNVSTGYQVFIHAGDNTNDFLIRLNNDGSTTSFQQNGVEIKQQAYAYGTGKWVMITWSWDGANHLLYKNSTLLSNTSSAQTYTTVNKLHQFGCQGETGIDPQDCSNYMKGTLDEISIWNRTLTQSDINDLYNSGSGFNPLTPTGLFQLEAKQYWDNASITSFNATINGTMYTTSNGTIQTDLLAIDGAEVNITIIKENFFNRTYADYNISNNLAGSIYQVEVDLSSQAIISNSSVTADLYKAGTQSHATTLYLGSGTTEITFNKSGWYNKPQNFTYSALENTTDTITGVYSNIMNISTIDYLGSPITNFTLDIDSLNYTYSITYNSSPNSYYEVPSINNTFNVSIDAGGSFSTTYNDSIISSASLETHQFILYGHNSMNITFYDEVAGTVINDSTISIEFISDIHATNESTTNGTVYVELLQPTSYTLRYSGTPDYPERFYEFTVTNRTHYDLDLYLLNESDTLSNVTISIIDQIGDPVEDSEVRVLKYDQDTNTYIVREIFNTNFEGQGVARIQLNTEFYKFLVYYGGELLKTTSPSYIYSTDLTIPITIGSVGGEAFSNQQDISYTLSFTTATNNFAFTFADDNSLMEEACLNVFKKTTTGYTAYNSSCLEATSGTILVGVENTSGVVYRADAYADLGDGQFFLDSLVKSFVADKLSGNTGLLLVLILTVVFALIGISNPVVALILTPLPIVLGSILGFINIEYEYSVMILIIAVIVAYTVNRGVNK